MSWATISEKNLDVLEAHIKLIEKEPRTHKFGILKELASEQPQEQPQNIEETKLDVKDEDQRLFFGDEFSDAGPSKVEEKKDENLSNESTLIDYEKEFDDEFMKSSNILLPSQLLMNDSIFTSNNVNNENFDLLSSLVPQKATDHSTTSECASKNSNPSKKSDNDVSKWFNLFSDLDPLSQQRLEQDDATKNFHAA